MARGSEPERDWYRVLGLEQGAGPEEVKAAHRQLAKRWHPDRNGSPEAHARMTELNRAREVLLDPVARAAFDRAQARRRPAAVRRAMPPAETPQREVHLRAKSPPGRPAESGPRGAEMEERTGGRGKHSRTGVFAAEPDFARDWYAFLGVKPDAGDGEIRAALRQKAIALQVPGISAAEFARRSAELRTANASIGTAAARAAFRRAKIQP